YGNLLVPTAEKHQSSDSHQHVRALVTLSCKYSTNSEDVYLYWYRQNPNQAPQYLLYKGARSYSSVEHSTNKRFKCTTSRDSTQLTIEALTMSDTAIYYCALRVAQGAKVTEKLYKNSFAQNFLSATMKCSFLPTVWDQFHSSRILLLLFYFL
uniref:Ig-like domain-containing protein n=1 Tax=Scleropages formosus TaxID=113540 RepID=A0A8C9TPZ2_SCLFO